MMGPHELRCPWCGAHAADLVRAREQMFGTGHETHYACCGGCGSLWCASTHPEEDLYPPGYYTHVATPQQTFSGLAGVLARCITHSAIRGRGHLARAAGWFPHGQVRTLSRALRAVRAARGADAHAGYRVLDVGCGAGHLAYCLGDAGMRVDGIDPGLPRAVALPGGGHLRPVTLGETEGKYDLIIFHHSLEHLDDPVDTLHQARQRLAPNGRVLVSAPTVSSRAFRRDGTRWWGLDAPRHRAIPSRAGMAEAASRAGYISAWSHDDGSTMAYWVGRRYRRGQPLVEPDGRIRSPWRTPWKWPACLWWSLRAWQLNRAGDGDQAVWVLTPRPD